MIETHRDVRSFFYDRLQEALRRRRVRPRPETELYLVELLGRTASAPEPAAGEPLVRLWARALECHRPRDRYRRFRELGDWALLRTGFFAQSCERRGVSRHYLAQMGSRAYGAASGLAPWTAAARLAPALQELAEGFETFAGVLEDLRELTSLRTPQDIVRLYDRWRRSHSPVVAERLREAGALPSLTAPPKRVLH